MKPRVARCASGGPPRVQARTIAETQVNAGENPARQMLKKVPELTVYFWVIKVLCTTVGETFDDFLNTNLRLGLSGTTYLMGSLPPWCSSSRYCHCVVGPASTGLPSSYSVWSER